MKRALLLFALAAGCASELDALSPAGPAARKLADLGWPLLVFFTVASAVMWAILIWAALRSTGSAPEIPPEVREKLRATGYLGAEAVPVPKEKDPTRGDEPQVPPRDKR